MKPKYKFVTKDHLADPDGYLFKIRSKILILHDGWDGDNIGWILEDGQVLTSSDYYNIFPMTLADIDSKIAQAEESLAGLSLARAALKGRTD